MTAVAGKENLIRKWAQSPWHCWFKDQPAWLELFAELWSRLPETAMRKIILTTRPLVVLPPVHFGRAIRITQPLFLGAWVLQLDEKLLERPKAEAIGILAHEMAHFCTEVSDDALRNDLFADELVSKWGLGHELLLALRRDLQEDHPRVRAAQNFRIP